jgi:hypothetical protein
VSGSRKRTCSGKLRTGVAVDRLAALRSSWKTACAWMPRHCWRTLAARSSTSLRRRGSHRAVDAAVDRTRSPEVPHRGARRHHHCTALRRPASVVVLPALPSTLPRPASVVAFGVAESLSKDGFSVMRPMKKAHTPHLPPVDGEPQASRPPPRHRLRVVRTRLATTRSWRP